MSQSLEPNRTLLVTVPDTLQVIDDEDLLYLAALGQIVRQAAHYEQVQRVVLCALIGSETMSVLAAGEMNSSLYESIKKVAGQHEGLDDAARQELTNIQGSGKTAMDHRNTYVHGQWFRIADLPGSTASYGAARSRRGEIKLEIEAHGLDDLIKCATDLRDISLALHNWKNNHLPDTANIESALRIRQKLEAKQAETPPQ